MRFPNEPLWWSSSGSTPPPCRWRPEEMTLTPEQSWTLNIEMIMKTSSWTPIGESNGTDFILLFRSLPLKTKGQQNYELLPKTSNHLLQLDQERENSKESVTSVYWVNSLHYQQYISHISFVLRLVHAWYSVEFTETQISPLKIYSIMNFKTMTHDMVHCSL